MPTVAAKTVSVKLDDEMRDRVKHLAEIRHRTAHRVMRNRERLRDFPRPKKPAAAVAIIKAGQVRGQRSTSQRQGSSHRRVERILSRKILTHSSRMSCMTTLLAIDAVWTTGEPKRSCVSPRAPSRWLL